jgi:hypothetical protein
MWGCLVHSPQLQRISYMAREHTNLLHEDIQGELGGNSGVQQQQGTLQKTWGESRRDLIVHAPRKGAVDPTTSPTQYQMHQEKRQRDAQCVG